MMQRQPQNQQEYYSKIFYEVSALVLNVMRPPPPSSFDFSDQVPAARREGPLFHQITPSGFASFLLGISLTLMLCGSVTFFLGFILMPWVIGSVIVLYFMGVVSTISMIGRAILCHNSAPPSPRKDIAWEDKRFCSMIGLEAFIEGLLENGQHCTIGLSGLLVPPCPTTPSPQIYNPSCSG